MTMFLQFAIIGIGAGSAYALFAQGAVLIYRGSGLVNFSHGALGMFAAYITFVECRTRHEMSTPLSIALGILAAVAIALLFQQVILKRLTNAAPIVRVISTLGLLAVTQSVVEMRYGKANTPVESFLPNDMIRWGDIRIQQQVLYIIAVCWVLTLVLFLLVKYTRIGLAITAAAENERAVRTLGWSPNTLALVTWGVGAALAGVAGILVAPQTGLSPVGFTQVVTVAALAAALLGGFRSFPLTLVGGMVVGIGESMVTLYKSDIQDFLHQDQITGLNRGVPFVIILIVLVLRGRGLPLRSHMSDRLPKLGTGRINVKAMLLASAILLAFLFFVFDNTWAAATYLSLASGIIVLSVIVLTGYAGQLSLAQWSIAGIGALIAASLIYRADWPIELAVPVGILLTIPAGMIFALPALRTRGVNLAVLTLSLGFTLSEVVLANANWLGDPIDGGTRIASSTRGEGVKIFGYDVQGLYYPHRWAIVCLVAFVLAGLVVSNLRRSNSGRRLIAIRTNERAAASLGISVFKSKLYAFGVASAIASLGGIMFAFQNPVAIYGSFNVFESISSVSFAVIGGLGYAMGAAFSAPNFVGGIGTRLIEDTLHLNTTLDFAIATVVIALILFMNVKSLVKRIGAFKKEGKAALNALLKPKTNLVMIILTVFGLYGVVTTWADFSTGDDGISLTNGWDALIGGLIMLLIIVANQDGAAAVASHEIQPLLRKAKMALRSLPATVVPELPIEQVSPATLKVDGLTVRFGGVVAVNDVSFEVRPGEVLGLIGPNGAGKTTIIDAVTGFVKSGAGSMALNERQIDSWGASQRSNAGLRRSFQSLELFEDISVEENIRAGAYTATRWGWLTDLFWPKKALLTSHAAAAIKEFGLESHLDKLPTELPYGTRRLVGIARAVANGPSIIMLDEPAAGLDENESKELARLIRRLATERNMGVLLVEHDVGLVMSTCDRIVCIDFGVTIAQGTPDEIRNNPRVREAYLGKANDDHATTSTEVN